MKTSHFLTIKNITLPQLAHSVDAPPEGFDWIHEAKLDGYRLIAVKRDYEVTLLTRRQHDWTHRFKSIAKAIAELPVKSLILDGEVVILNDQGLPDFQLLQNSLLEQGRSPFHYFVFDLIQLDHQDLRTLPLIERKSKLKRLLNRSKRSIIHNCEYYTLNGSEVFAKAKELGLEGIISKRKDSPYISGRSRYWVKTKYKRSDEFIVCGYTKADVKGRHFGSLFLAVREQNKLRYCGNVGTGFDEQKFQQILGHFEDLIIPNCPFAVRPPDCSSAVWLKPKLIVEVEYSGITQDKILRHPSYKGLREDKMEISKSQLITLQKQKDYQTFDQKYCNDINFIYPDLKLKKSNVIDYYELVAPYLFPHIKNRLLNLYRLPKNYPTGFYQRYATDSVPQPLLPWTLTTKLVKEHDYFYLAKKGDLTKLASLDVIEIHSWGATIKDIEHPNLLTFDIDPAANVSWSRVVKAAFELKALLECFSLKSFVKTTGGKGLHVVAPIISDLDWGHIHAFAKTIVEHLVSEHPKEYVSRSIKSLRDNKIYIDYLRNVKGSTAIVPYSLRANKHAYIAAPIAWDELTKAKKDTTFTHKVISDRLIRLKRDPWKEFFQLKQSIKLKKS